MYQDGARDDRRWRKAIIGLDDDSTPLAARTSRRVLLRRLRQGVGVHAQKERAGDALPCPVFAYRLADGENVRLVETLVEGAAAMAAGAEGDALGRGYRSGHRLERLGRRGDEACGLRVRRVAYLGILRRTSWLGFRENRLTLNQGDGMGPTSVGLAG
jgi:hypothetical protein